VRPAALLRVPGVPSKRIQQAVTFTDLAPTLTRILGDRQSFDQLRGRSLTPLLHRSSLGAEDPESFVVETFAVENGRSFQAALVKFPLKLMYVEQGQKFSLFDLSRDPGELDPLDPSADARGPELLSELNGYLERTRAR
jgi:arylsulfatase A-like enzyme